MMITAHAWLSQALFTDPITYPRLAEPGLVYRPGNLPASAACQPGSPPVATEGRR